MNRYTELGDRPIGNIINYPEIPLNSSDIYAITEWGDRFDNLAFQFYQDPTLWWIISTANPNLVSFSSLFIPIGTTIRIPINISNIISNYKAINR
tara:strand:+ start:2269 stop:2553 length:285 start_codon:yes stop_codon:yes gene_type:complete